MSLKKIDIFQWYVSDILAHHQWLKHKHPEDLTKYSFNSIPALFLLVLAYHDIQGFYHRPQHTNSVVTSTAIKLYRGHQNLLSVCYVVMKNLPGGRLNKKDGLTRYGNSDVKDKTS